MVKRYHNRFWSCFSRFESWPGSFHSAFQVGIDVSPIAVAGVSAVMHQGRAVETWFSRGSGQDRQYLDWSPPVTWTLPPGRRRNTLTSLRTPNSSK